MDCVREEKKKESVENELMLIKTEGSSTKYSFSLVCSSSFLVGVFLPLLGGGVSWVVTHDGHQK